MRIINGAPTYMKYLSGYTGPKAFAEIQDALNRNFLVGCDTTGSVYGLAGGHAYMVLSTHVIKDTSGRTVVNLIRVRNPWNIDTYNGPWADGSS